MLAVLPNGVKLSYESQGDGEPLIMIMGIGASKESWGKGLKHDLAATYRVITFDNRGIGGSSGRPYVVSISDMAADVIGLMDYLGIAKAHVLGVSMGGMIAQQVAINYPDRLLKLVLACTTYRPFPRLINPWVPLLGLPMIAPTWFSRALFTKPFLESNPALVEEFRSIVVKYLPSPLRLAAQVIAIMWHNSRRGLTQVRTATLVIAGTGDRLIPFANSQRLAKAIPNAKLVGLPDLGHGFFFEPNAGLAAEVTAFLGGVSIRIGDIRG